MIALALTALTTLPPPTAAAPAPGAARPLARLPGPAGTAAAFSPDGKLLLTAGGDSARVWDAQTYQPLSPPLKHADGTALSLARLSPDATKVLTTAADEARLWDAATGKPLHTFRHDETVWSAGFAPDGSTLVTAGGDGLVRIRDAASGAAVLDLPHPAAVKFAAFSPDGRRLLTVTVPNAPDEDWIAENKSFRSGGVQLLRVWDVATGKTLFRRADENTHLSDRPRWFPPAAFSRDGKWAASASVWLAVVWDTKDGRALCSVDARHEKLGWALGWPRVMAFSPDGSLFAVSGGDAVGVWKVARGNGRDPPLVGSLAARGVEHIEFSPDGRSLLFGAGWGNAGVWQLGAGQVLPIPGGRDLAELPAVAFSPDARRVAAGFPSDGFTGVWQVPEPQQR